MMKLDSCVINLVISCMVNFRKMQRNFRKMQRTQTQTWKHPRNSTFQIRGEKATTQADPLIFPNQVGFDQGHAPCPQIVSVAFLSVA